MTDVHNVTIVGAGQAGIQVAQVLRRRGYGGGIRMLGNEGYPPYQRPPLSKTFLKSDMAQDRLAFRPEKFFADQGIDTDFSNAVEAIDVDRQAVRCADGQQVDYDRLVLSTGATPVALPVPGASLDGVMTLRGLDHAKAIRKILQRAERIVVIGGGYIGLEAASAARQLGVAVTVVEQQSRLLSRVTSPAVSDYYHDLHRGHGVDVRLNASVSRIDGDAAVAGVVLDSGESIAADAALVGIGVRPSQGLAEAAGLACDDGILINMQCQTSDPRIYAAGDCARSTLENGTTMRLESVHNALVQGEQTAVDILGEAPPPYDPPWFWSDQYETKLQTVGLFKNYDETLLRGDPADDSFAALYFADDCLIAIDAVNDPVSFMAGKQILKRGLSIDRATARDAGSLRELVPAR